MSRVFNFFLVVVFLSISVQAQKNPVNGIITLNDPENPIVLQDVVISNLKTKEKFISNEKGEFRIYVSLNDELKFEKIGYEDHYIRISNKDLANRFLQISMAEEVIELSEVRINTLDKNLGKNLKIKEDKVETMYKNLGINPSLRNVEIDRNVTSTINNNGITDPALWIAMITGKRKKDIKQMKYFKKADVIDDLREYFGDEVFVNDLELPKDKITEFITFCYDQTKIGQFYKEKKFDEILWIFYNNVQNYKEKLKESQ